MEKSARIGGNDVVSKLVNYQLTGEGFDGLWADLHPIVAELSRRNLRKLGVRLGMGDDDGPVAEVMNETVIKLQGLSAPGAGGRFNPAKMKKPGMSGLRGWLWRVVRSQAVNWKRESLGGRALKITPESSLEWNQVPQGGDGSSITKRQLAKIVRPDLLPILEECIGQLVDPSLRKVVLLKLDEELAERPSAKRLQTTVSMVHRRLKKAYALLRPMLEQRGVDASWLAA